MYDAGDRVGRYTLLERLGSGGFTVVWRARVRDGEEVALKVPNYGGVNDRDEIDRRLRREVDVLRRIESLGGHPNVVSLTDAAVNGPDAYLAMDLMEGEDLAASVEGGTLRPGIETFRAVAPDVCSALSFLHDHDLCYLDLKPRNVLVAADGQPVLIDFNTATRGHADTRFREDPLKPPELTVANRGDSEDSDSQSRQDTRAHSAGPWSDVYSLGRLFAHLLVGDRDPDLRGADDLPCDDVTAAAIDRATLADPRRRQQTATELLVELFAEDGSGGARLDAVDGDEAVPVSPGDTLGRTGGPVEPDVAVSDPDEYVSPRHLRFDRRGDVWFVTDTSTNGTYLRSDGGWLKLLSRSGHRKRGREDAVPRRRSPASRRIADGDRIALVDLEYPVRFRFCVEG